jgi:hypothetical protein
MSGNAVRIRLRGVFVALTALVWASPVALAAQSNGSTQDAADEAAAIAHADSARAALVQPPGTKPSGAARLVRMPFRAFGATIGVVAGVGYGAYKLLDNLGVIEAGRLINRDLESWDVKVRPRSIGNRSSVAAGVRWRGSGTPLFLEGAYSIRGYQLARGGIQAGDTLTGLELAAGHRKMTQIHFWGTGSDAALADESDYGWTRRDLSGSAWAGLVPHLRVGVEGGVEEDTGERGNDVLKPDVVDQFADALPFGALGTDRFAHAGASLDVDFTSVKSRTEQLHGVRLIGSWSGYRGFDETDAEFHIGSVDVMGYLPVSRQHAFALRGLAHDVFGEEGFGVPLYYLPRLGSTEGLRGQKGWRYRDRSVIATMAEWRYQVWWHPGDPNYRVDAFVFADRAAVGPSLSAIHWEDFKTTPGVGVRFMDHGVGRVEAYLAFRGDKPRAGLKLGASF